MPINYILFLEKRVIPTAYNLLPSFSLWR